MKKRFAKAKEYPDLINPPQLQTKADEDFDGIVALALEICKTSIATINFIDNSYIKIKAKTEVKVSEISEDWILHLNTINAGNVTVVTDVLNDERFDNPLIRTYPFLRFYTSIPIKGQNGTTVGQLSVMDIVPRTLTDQQLSSLHLLSNQVVSILKLRAELEKFTTQENFYPTHAKKEKAIFQKAFNAVIILNNKGEIVQWSSKAEMIFGWTKKEVIGKPLKNTIISDQFREALSLQIQYNEGTGEENRVDDTFEFTAIGKDSRKINIELNISATKIENELYYVCVISDNTKQKIAASKLDKQKEFYENILNKIPTDIAVFDPNHRYLFVNPGAIQNPALRKYIIGKDDFEYANFRKRDKSIAEKRREKFLEVTTSDKEIRWEDSLKDPDGNTITHLRRLFPVHNEEGKLTMVIGFGIDITERKLLEEKQSSLVQQLSSQNTQLIDFCNIVSHNLRAPLANMSMLVNFIKESSDEKEQKEFIEMLSPVVDNLHRTFNELVESIQIKQDLEIESEDIVLEDCLKRTLVGLEIKIKECNATIVSDFKAAPVIRFPSKYLLSIFHNLITNALKYHDPSRKLEIKLQTQKLNNSTLFLVTDNGLGIDVIKHKDNIFKIGKVFHRHPNAKGFGLFMTKTQVEACGGKIWVESVPGKGSTFFISFLNQR